MRRTTRHAFAAVTVGAASLAGLAGVATAADPDVPRTTVYDVGSSAATLLRGLDCVEHNLYRQAPGDGAAFCSDADDDLGTPAGARYWDGSKTINLGLHRAKAKVDGHALAKLRTAEAMAARLKAEIEDPDEQADSGQVGVDEIGNAFRDPKTPVEKKAFYCNGTKLGTFPVAHRVECSVNGWKLVKRTIQPEPPPPGSPAADLAGAMEQLARTPHPDGGSYAERVHFYAAPAFVTSIAVGRGTHFTQDRTGTRPVRW